MWKKFFNFFGRIFFICLSLRRDTFPIPCPGLHCLWTRLAAERFKILTAKVRATRFRRRKSGRRFSADVSKAGGPCALNISANSSDHAIFFGFATPATSHLGLTRHEAGSVRTAEGGSVKFHVLLSNLYDLKSFFGSNISQKIENRLVQNCATDVY